jgi:hypothetical protein
LIHYDGTEVIEFDGVPIHVEGGSRFGCGRGGSIGKGEWFVRGGGGGGGV